MKSKQHRDPHDVRKTAIEDAMIYAEETVRKADILHAEEQAPPRPALLKYRPRETPLTLTQAQENVQITAALHLAETCIAVLVNLIENWSGALGEIRDLPGTETESIGVTQARTLSAKALNYAVRLISETAPLKSL